MTLNDMKAAIFGSERLCFEAANMLAEVLEIWETTGIRDSDDDPVYQKIESAGARFHKVLSEEAARLFAKKKNRYAKAAGAEAPAQK